MVLSPRGLGPEKILCALPYTLYNSYIFFDATHHTDRLCGLKVRVLDYRYRGPGFDSRALPKKKIVMGLERGPLSLVSTTEELLDRKVAAPV
jgi:hypothetical protein